MSAIPQKTTHDILSDAEAGIKTSSITSIPNDFPVPGTNSPSTLPRQNSERNLSRTNIASILKTALGTNSEPNRKEAAADLKNASYSEASYSKYRQTQPVTIFSAFQDHSMETQFNNFFVRQNKSIFRITVELATVVILMLYILAFIIFPGDSQKFKSVYESRRISVADMKSNPSLCTPGYFCHPCPPSGYCGEYLIGPDIGFAVSVVIVGLSCLVISVTLRQKTWILWYSTISSVFLLFTMIVGIILRYRIVEPNRNPLVAGMFLIVAINCCFSGIKMRYIHTVSNLIVIIIGWAIISVALNPIARNAYRYEPTLVGISLVISLIVQTTAAYRTEIYYRDVFLRTQFSTKVNSKLANQLRALQKTFTEGVVDLESPLEKSIAILKSILADPSLPSEQFHSLEIVVQFLNSPQLLQPDLEGQFGTGTHQNQRSGSLAIDSDQRAWLLSEIAKKRADLKRSHSNSAKKKRKQSVYGIITTEEEEYPEMPQLPQEYSTLKREKSNQASINANSFLANAADSDIQNLNPNDPFNYAHSRYTMEHPPGLPEKHALDLVKESYAGSLVQISRPKSHTKTISFNPEVLQPLITKSDEWNWNIFDFCDACPGGKPLFILGWHFFNVNRLFEEFQLPMEKFNNFLWKIQDGYRDLQYHNSVHATDVMHAVNYFIQFDKISSIINNLDMMALYVAAAVHDFDHPGVNNNFLINTANPLAVLYNDKAVLESYHVSSAFQVLLKPENNFLSHLSKPEWQAFRELVIEMVLATDLSQHYTILSSFKTRLQNAFNPAEIKEDRILLFKMLIKIADVSNPTKDFQIYSKWTSLVLEEWKTQGDQEKLMGIQVSPFMDRDNPNVLLSSQIGFIDFIIVPMFETFNNGFMKIPQPMEELEKNRQYWQRVKEAKDFENANGGNATTLTIIRKTAPTSTLVSRPENPSDSPNAGNTITIIRKAREHMAQEGMTLATPNSSSTSNSTQKINQNKK